jgi:glycine dehydrogenase subunit 2
VIIPDSAHGTNPASAVLSGYEIVEVKSDNEGRVDLEDLKKVADAECAAFMLTNPNTLGLFEKNILQISKILKEHGIMLYLDGANLNAMLGLCRPGDMGFDVVHFNLHKTFSTPHGGGGPGSGPVGVKESLVPFLPVPVIEKKDECFYLNYDIPKSIGKVQGFYGNFGVMVKAYAYIRTLGAEGLKEVSENAILNANYMKKRLEGYFALPYKVGCMHEFVLSGSEQKKAGISTKDISKRLLDYGLHPPTVYFPLIVDEALMIEPTETETKEVLDKFCDAMIAIAKETKENPEIVKSAPHTTPVARLDEAKAAKELDLRWKKATGD